ncbi:AraC family transcriptional regulator [Paenibacillus spongiae]|uniref:AraC family transcriptional regulator n=1 Tax=Paenibacillus spongiae TaxID=2909671 RepID=A0ABY5SI17_9BACL|nr:AraC family transcriptional regulator [Paenibacillus spongiae]UVI33394.1 AraC family transcriptional regulator [Paenibacillus spongiae]
MLTPYLNMIDHHIQYLHVQRAKPHVEFHLHRGCEIFFLIQGDVKYFVEKTVYPLRFGDLIITNEHEIHKPSFSTEALYERITIEFPPAMAELFHTDGFNPLDCFYNRPNGQRNKVAMSAKDSSLMMSLFQKYEYYQANPADGDAILKLGCFMEILVLINRLFKQQQPGNGIDPHHKLSPVLDYIELHLDRDLSLDCLEKKFYINKYYLLKLFKKHTGSTVHEYIVSKRIGMAKKLLVEGCDVMEACLKSGFNDYTSFLRMFKKKVGLLPKDYVKSVR